MTVEIPPFKRWSYSTYDLYKLCPFKYLHEKILRTVPFETSEAAQWGVDVHEALENRVGKNIPLTERFSAYEKVAKLVESLPGETFCEKELAVQRQFYKPVNPKERDKVWCLGIMDVLKIDEKNRVAYVLDYKTGKKKFTEQMDLYAALVFQNFDGVNAPLVHEVRSALIWLKSDELTRNRYNINDRYALWDKFVGGVQRMENAHKNGIFVKSSNYLCRSWCKVVECEFCGGK